MSKKYIIYDCTKFESLFKDLFNTEDMHKRVNSYIEYNDTLKRDGTTLESLKERFNIEAELKTKEKRKERREKNKESLSIKEKEAIKYWHDKILAAYKISDKYYY